MCSPTGMWQRTDGMWKQKEYPCFSRPPQHKEVSKRQNTEGSLHSTSYTPALCCDFTKRVARSMHTIKQPVTLGSRVPLCPVFSTRSIRRIQATTSWEDGLEGLSRLMKPVLEWKEKQCTICYCALKQTQRVDSLWVQLTQSG